MGGEHVVKGFFRRQPFDFSREYYGVINQEFTLSKFTGV